MIERGLSHFFLRQKPVMMLVKLKSDEKPRYASLLAKEVDCTYSHTVRILQLLQRRKLIEFDKKGRLKLIRLTPYGRDIAINLDKIITQFRKVENR